MSPGRHDKIEVGRIDKGGFEAVSYTHLDVYKRQDKTEAKRAAKKPPGLAKKAVRGARTEAWFYVHNKIHEVEPVSYTHLDVYKRQL